MPVVFDEVVGTVVPDTTGSSAEAAPPPNPELNAIELQTHLRRIERRKARHKAD